MIALKFPEKHALKGIKLTGPLLAAGLLAGCATGHSPAGADDYKQVGQDQQQNDNMVAAGVHENENRDFKPALQCITDTFLTIEKNNNNAGVVLKAEFGSKDKKGEEGGYSPRVTPDNTNAMTVALHRAGWPMVTLPSRQHAQIMQYLQKNDLFVDGAGNSVAHKPGVRPPMYKFKTVTDEFSFNQNSGGAEVSISGIGFEAIKSSTRLGVTTTISYAGNGSTVVGSSEVNSTMFTTNNGIKIANLDTIIPDRMFTFDVGYRSANSADAANKITMRGGLYFAIEDMVQTFEERLEQLNDQQLRRMGYAHVANGSFDFNKAVQECREELPQYGNPKAKLEEARTRYNVGNDNNQTEHRFRSNDARP